MLYESCFGFLKKFKKFLFYLCQKTTMTHEAGFVNIILSSNIGKADLMNTFLENDCLYVL